MSFEFSAGLRGRQGLYRVFRRLGGCWFGRMCAGGGRGVCAGAESVGSFVFEATVQ